MKRIIRFFMLFFMPDGLLNRKLSLGIYSRLGTRQERCVYITGMLLPIDGPALDDLTLDRMIGELTLHSGYASEDQSFPNIKAMVVRAEFMDKLSNSLKLLVDGCNDSVGKNVNSHFFKLMVPIADRSPLKFDIGDLKEE